MASAPENCSTSFLSASRAAALAAKQVFWHLPLASSVPSQQSAGATCTAVDERSASRRSHNGSCGDASCPSSGTTLPQAHRSGAHVRSKHRPPLDTTHRRCRRPRKTSPTAWARGLGFGSRTARCSMQTCLQEACSTGGVSCLTWRWWRSCCFPTCPWIALYPHLARRSRRGSRSSHR